MWIADNWKDYEVIDCSKGEKLERWGDYILVRPDPQVIWDTPKTDKGWKSRNGHYHRSKKGGGDLKSFDMDHTLGLIDDIVKNKQAYVAKLEEKAKHLNQMAHRNEKYLMHLLEKRK